MHIPDTYLTFPEAFASMNPEVALTSFCFGNPLFSLGLSISVDCPKKISEIFPDTSAFAQINTFY